MPQRESRGPGAKPLVGAKPPDFLPKYDLIYARKAYKIGLLRY